MVADLALVFLITGPVNPTIENAGWTVARWTYQTLWKYAPKPADYEHYQPPDRFASPHP